MNRHVYFRQQEKNELYHHGIKGQKWGIRRYQNPDGTLTAEGRKRYGKFSRQEVKRLDISDTLAESKRLKNEYYEMSEKCYEIANSEMDVNKLNNKGLNKRIDEMDSKDLKNIFEGISDEQFMEQCLPKTNEFIKDTTKKGIEYDAEVQNTIEKTLNLVGNKYSEEIRDKYQKELNRYIPTSLKMNTLPEKTYYESEITGFLDNLVEGYDLENYEKAYRAKKYPIESSIKDTLGTEKLGKIERDLNADKESKQYKEAMTRAKKGADLGLKALNKIGYDSYDENKGITGGDRWWFIFEDQTIGEFAVCDLINQGKTKAEVKSLIEQAQDATYEQQETNSTIWELNEFGRRSPSYINKFIDACYDIKKE